MWNDSHVRADSARLGATTPVKEPAMSGYL